MPVVTADVTGVTTADGGSTGYPSLTGMIIVIRPRTPPAPRRETGGIIIPDSHLIYLFGYFSPIPPPGFASHLSLRLLFSYSTNSLFDNVSARISVARVTSFPAMTISINTWTSLIHSAR